MEAPLDFEVVGDLDSVTRSGLAGRRQGQSRQQKATDERGAAANTENLFLRQTPTLKRGQAQEEEPRNARQLPAARREADPFAVPLDQSGLKEVLEFLDLPAVLALLDRIALGGFRDAARRSDFHQGAQPIE